MTPQEKAKELVNKFYLNVLDRNGTSAMNTLEVKQCALIAVDEIISLLIKFHGRHINDCSYEIEYYKKVKEEIENYE
jgi:hypothetical protein